MALDYRSWASKLIRLCAGVVGGRDKPFGVQLCGTWPTWESRSLRLGLPLLFLAIGLYFLGCLAEMLGAQVPGR
jgi:hypothetical protein